MLTRIICIGAEPPFTEEAVSALRAAGYEVMVAASSRAGLALLRLFPPKLVLIHSKLMDALLPVLKAEWPSLPVLITDDPVVVSGFTDGHGLERRPGYGPLSHQLPR